LREGVAEEDVSWIYGVVRSFERDGLAVVFEERRSCATDALVEDGLAYGAEDSERDDLSEARVRLP
jgi:hypothetical protein